jgi:hypothetical protein
METLMVSSAHTEHTGKRSQHLRRTLVAIGFLLCCAITGRFFTYDATSVPEEQSGRVVNATVPAMDDSKQPATKK